MWNRVNLSYFQPPLKVAHGPQKPDRDIQKLDYNTA